MIEYRMLGFAAKAAQHQPTLFDGSNFNPTRVIFPPFAAPAPAPKMPRSEPATGSSYASPLKQSANEPRAERATAKTTSDWDNWETLFSRVPTKQAGIARREGRTEASIAARLRRAGSGGDGSGSGSSSGSEDERPSRRRGSPPHGGAGGVDGRGNVAETTRATSPSRERAASPGLFGGVSGEFDYDELAHPPGSLGSARTWTIKARIKAAQLPNEGKIRFVPDDDYDPSEPILRGPGNGYLDRFSNEWIKGPSRTAGQPFEWDVQLSELGKRRLGHLSRDGRHINVSLDGRITHR